MSWKENSLYSIILRKCTALHIEITNHCHSDGSESLLYATRVAMKNHGQLKDYRQLIFITVCTSLRVFLSHFQLHATCMNIHLSINLGPAVMLRPAHQQVELWSPNANRGHVLTHSAAESVVFVLEVSRLAHTCR